MMERQISQKYNDPLENFLRTNIERDFSIFSETTDPYFIINSSGKILYANHECRLQLGYSLEEMMNIELKDICSEEELNQKGTYFIKDNREKFTSFYLQLIKKNRDFMDSEVFCFPIFLKNKVIGSYVVLQEAQGLRLQTEKYYSALIEHSPDSIFILKGSTIVDVSDEALRMLGVEKKDEVLGESFFLLLDSNYIEIFYDKLHFVKQGDITEKFDQRIVKVDGTIIEAEVKILPTVYNGEFAYHVIVKDTSENIRLTLLSEKQAVAGQLAAGIAHEIRNPITAIKGFLKLMASNEDIKFPYYEILESEIVRIEVILNELMGLVKPTKLRLGKLEIGEIIENVLTLMKPYALLNGIEIIHCKSLVNTLILGDENQLKQVFINYIKNAIEAMPGGGKIQVDSSQREKEVSIIITDEGGGIPLEVQKRIGEPFFTTKENGTGLGMIVSHQIIKAHNGFITINNKKKGASIEVNLPILRE